MAKIFVSRKLPGNSLDKLLNSGNEVIVSEFDRPLAYAEFIERAKGCDGILTFLTDKINTEVITDIGPQLKVIANYAVGFDNIKVEDATNAGVVIANTPSDEVNEAVAEHAWALMLALARRIVEADEATRRGAYKGWEPAIFLGTNMIGKTLGIVGMGRIGTMVARRAKGFNMKVLYYNRSRDEKAEEETGAVYSDLDSVLSQSDFISLHLPLTPETRGMVNRDVINKMKKGAYFVNTARGPIVIEQDLADALRDGHLNGVGLDVFENEPAINPELVGMENVIVTPHIASATWEARNKMGEQAVDAILQTINGEMPSNIVNKEVWDHRRS